MMGSGNGMFFGGGFMWLIWILIIVAVFVALKVMIGTGGSSGGQQESPLEILQKRFARGEIDEEEFRRRKKELEGG